MRATQMQKSALLLEALVNNPEGLRRGQEWGRARVALEQCFEAIEAEESEIPVEWRLWHIEIELAHGNWDGANKAVKYVGSFDLSAASTLVFLTGPLIGRNLIAMR